ncbi:RING-H2 finger protein ATL74 isoform X2 [Cucumis sativus]|uniref:RING-H2 finger protein ATL74 isoform X2 n=1 Tax=Cucumis sativus TaxID=3659 RepID=UPI0012F50404|nr:RING-H2 finger protein ATL74 isoform X2 [Cucumis sativus]
MSISSQTISPNTHHTPTKYVQGPPPPAFPAHTTLDNNMVILLAALLYALVGALVMNSILRCIWRRWWSAAAARVERQELEEIPVAVYEGEGRMKIRVCQ